MGLSKEHFHIARILAESFLYLNREKRKEGESWDKVRFHRLERMIHGRSYEAFEERAKAFNTRAAWEKTCRRIGGSETAVPTLGKHSWFRRTRVAIIAGIILLVGGIMYGSMYFIGRERAMEAIVYEIEAGKDGTVLQLHDGPVLAKHAEKSIFFREKDGALMVTDSMGKKYVEQDILPGKKVFNTIRTLKGMEYTLVLQDGTRIYLNSESEITFPAQLDGATREVSLAGEAFFEVEKDSLRPFIVRMKDVAIEVLGTSFNVCFYEDKIAATLVEGSICMTTAREHVRIKPGEQVMYDFNSDDLTVDTVDVALYTAWREGKFIFKNERLEDVLNVLSRWYDLEYVFKDPVIKDIRIGAKLDRYSDVGTIMNMLELNASISVEKESGLYVIGMKK